MTICTPTTDDDATLRGSLTSEYASWGKRTVLNANWTTHADPAEGSYSFSISFQGLMRDAESGLVYNRARMLHPVVGRFMQRDPLGCVDGTNLYAAYHVMQGEVDPSGLLKMPDWQSLVDDWLSEQSCDSGGSSEDEDGDEDKVSSETDEDKEKAEEQQRKKGFLASFATGLALPIRLGIRLSPWGRVVAVIAAVVTIETVRSPDREATGTGGGGGGTNSKRVKCVYKRNANGIISIRTTIVNCAKGDPAYLCCLADHPGGGFEIVEAIDLP